MPDAIQPPKPEKEETYFSWVSPSRIFKRRDKEYFTNIAAIVFLLSIILVFAREFVLIAAMISIVFLIYVLSTVPPEEVKHRLSNLGLESTGHFYRWEELYDFWFENRWGQIILVIRPISGSQLVLLLDTVVNKDKVRKIVEKYITYREQPEKSWVDNAASWITEKVPLEKPS